MNAKQRLLARDIVYKGFLHDCRIAVATTKNLAQAGVDRFHVRNRGAASVFGKALTASSLVSSFLKGEERAILEFQGKQGDSISHVYAESLHLGEVRGFIHGSEVEAPGSGSEMTDALAPNSVCQVKTILYNNSHPFVGAVASEDGTLATGLQNYFERSEQVASLIRLSHGNTEADDGSVQVQHSGGVLLQKIADSDGTVFDSLQEYFSDPGVAFSTASRPPDHRFEDFVANALCEALPGKVDLNTVKNNFNRIPVDFFCRCSKESFISKLAGFPKDQLEGLLNDPEARTLTCQFCNTNYPLLLEDLNQLLSEKKE